MDSTRATCDSSIARLRPIHFQLPSPLLCSIVHPHRSIPLSFPLRLPPSSLHSLHSHNLLPCPTLINLSSSREQHTTLLVPLPLPLHLQRHLTLHPPHPMSPLNSIFLRMLPLHMPRILLSSPLSLAVRCTGLHNNKPHPPDQWALSLLACSPLVHSCRFDSHLPHLHHFLIHLHNMHRCQVAAYAPSTHSLYPPHSFLPPHPLFAEAHRSRKNTLNSHKRNR